MTTNPSKWSGMTTAGVAINTYFVNLWFATRPVLRAACWNLREFFATIAWMSSLILFMGSVMTWWLTRADALIFTSIVGLGMAVLVDRLAPVSNKGRDFIVMLGIIASCAVPIYSAVQTVRNGFWPADLLLFVSSIEPKYDSARLSLCLTLLVVSATAFLSQAVFHELARALKDKKGGAQQAMKQ